MQKPGPSSNARHQHRKDRDSLACALEQALDESVESSPAGTPFSGGDPMWALKGREPLDERDSLEALLTIYDLWMAPIWTTGGREAFQGHVVVAALKWRLEAEFVERLTERAEQADHDERATADATIRASSVEPTEDTLSAIRRIAARDLVPSVYDWLEDEADWAQLVDFLALEGGPDAGFDDLVALTQVGIHEGPKVTLGANYWDEMGRGEVDRVHTVLHDRLVEAIDMPRLKRSELPVSALERNALGGLLATNRRLQPEAVGAFGLVELQAGPRCRAVVKALTRLEGPEAAFAFYEEHARADPLHGKAWLDKVIAPLSERHPRWGPRMVEGALWREEVNRRFFDDIGVLLTEEVPSGSEMVASGRHHVRFRPEHRDRTRLLASVG